MAQLSLQLRMLAHQRGIGTEQMSDRVVWNERRAVAAEAQNAVPPWWSCLHGHTAVLLQTRFAGQRIGQALVSVLLLALGLLAREYDWLLCCLEEKFVDVLLIVLVGRKYVIVIVHA